MDYEYLSIMSSILVVIGYTPEIYFIIIYKKSKKSNILIWLIWILSNVLGILYCGLNKNYLIMINFILNFLFCCISFILNIYFLYTKPIEHVVNNKISKLYNISDSNSDLNPDSNSYTDIENNNSEIIIIDNDNCVNDILDNLEHHGYSNRNNNITHIQI